MDLCFGNTSSTQNIEILCHFEIVFPKYNFNVKNFKIYIELVFP